MEADTSEALEKIRRQFDFGPYPRIPIDQSPKDDVNKLFMHSLVTANYLKTQQVVDTKGKVILDVGCGTGYKSLALAEANPGAKIIGVDLSPESIKLAEERLKYHNFDNAEFYVLDIENLPSLGITFDYINCDEMLYLLADPAAGLRAMKAVLNLEGIIRTNLHSALQRAAIFRAQKVFKLMGLMDDNPEEFEMGLVQEIMKALHDNVDLKVRAWSANYEGDDAKERILMNYLFQEDKGYTVQNLFQFLESAELEFISMVNWRQWSVTSLFKDADNLPAFLAMNLPEAPVEMQLHLYELMHPIHRLLDFWCGHINTGGLTLYVAEWQDRHWQEATVHLHPQLNTPKTHEAFLTSVREQKPLDLAVFLSATAGGSFFVDTPTIACLLKLAEAPQSFANLLAYWLELNPKDQITLEPINPQAATATLKKILTRLETFMHVMLETTLGEDF
jgi:ubiquinone/menaquinone biosynthesis C-methylase UbiE